MIKELGLKEEAKPVRERAGWSKPQRILIVSAPAEQLQALRAIAPGVEFLAAGNVDEAVKSAPRADVVIGTCSPAVIEAARKARWVQVYNAGVESCVTVPAFRERNVLLTNMQRIGGPAMADHVMAMILHFSRGLDFYQRAMPEWKDDQFASAFKLEGKTMFIAGLGGIGLELAKRARAFGMRVTGTRASSRDALPNVDEVGLPEDLPRLMGGADIIVNTLPLTAETRGLFDAKVFSAAKRGAWFFNVGRGATVVTNDLVAALQSGALAGAGLDVTDPEPLPSDHPLWKQPRVLITPHVSASEEDRSNRWLLVRENLRRYVAGDRMLSVVDPGKGY
jgi:phosphoglycerate dehydrogenase-like enzyme